MSNLKIDRAKAIGAAFQCAMGALDWLNTAGINLEDANSDAATAKRMEHARQKLLEGVAALDMRPTSAWPLPRRVTGDGA